MKRRKDKKPSVTALKHKLDTLWSVWIRRSNANSDGMCHCCSCGMCYRWDEMDCGHFISRNHNGGRFDERNTNPQCRKCNRFREGNKAGYAVFLQEKYGPQIISELNQLQYTIKRFTPEELQELILHTRENIKGLSNAVQ